MLKSNRGDDKELQLNCTLIIYIKIQSTIRHYIMSHIDQCINAANSVDKVKFKGTMKNGPYKKHSTPHGTRKTARRITRQLLYLFSVNNNTCVATHCILMAVQQWVQELLQIFFETVLDILQNILNFIICSTLSIVLMFKQY